MIAYHTEDVKTKIVIPTIKYNIPFLPDRKAFRKRPCVSLAPEVEILYDRKRKN